MMEFIVLGLVPGTQYQLTFLGVLILSLGISLVVLYRVEKPRLENKIRKITAALQTKETA